MQTRAQTSSETGYAIALMSSFCSGLATVIGKYNLEYVSPLLMNSLIFTIATTAFAVWTLPRRNLRQSFSISRVGWFWILMFALTSWMALWAFWAGVQRMDPSLASFLNRSEVLVAILLGIIFLRERFTKLETIGTILAFAGIAIMRFTLRVEYSEGFWYVLIGAIFFGTTEFVSKIAVRHAAPVIVAFIRNGFLALFFWITLFSGGYSGLEDFGTVWMTVLALGIIGPVLARILYLFALKRLELSKVAVISQIQPVFVMIIALIFLSQFPTLRETTGGLFLLFGIVVMVWGRYRKKRITQA